MSFYMMIDELQFSLNPNQSERERIPADFIVHVTVIKEIAKSGWTKKMADRKSCDLCPQTFESGQILYYHSHTHSGGKKHNCAQHNKSLRQAGNLKTHLLIHTGENHTRAHIAIIQQIKVLI